MHPLEDVIAALERFAAGKRGQIAIGVAGS
jgi:hypothetical protein